MKSARATAHSNIALVKYWGKRDAVPGRPDDLNLPAVGSLSLTLDRLRTETELHPAERDVFFLGGELHTGAPATKVFRHLDRVWSAAGKGDRPRPACRVVSINHLPTAAGLASSASGFAALTVAAAAAYGLEEGPEALSILARRGSGSAARSLFGGFVRLHRGERADGLDCVARPLHPQGYWDLRLLVVHTAKGAKSMGSTDGMKRCRETSPYYGAWVDTSEADLAAAEAALAARDLRALGAVMERSCFKMHACMMATDPAILYWNGTTLEVIRAVWQARERGIEAYVTSDAGPHVKVLCAAADADSLARGLRAHPGVHDVDVVAAGPDARAEVLS